MIRRSRRAGARRAVTVAAAVLAVATLGACGSAQAGAAAVIGGNPKTSVGADRRITVSEVQDASAQLTSLLTSEAGFTQSVVLGQLILAPYVLAAGASVGLGISGDDVTQQLKQELAGQAAQNGQPAPTSFTLDPETITVLRSVLTLNTIQSSSGSDTAQLQQFVRAVQGAVAKDGVKVSPRYGNFDVNQLTVTDSVPNWLKATASPSPTATSTP